MRFGRRHPGLAVVVALQARALNRLGRREEGIELIEAELALARQWGASGPIGHALRVLGTLQREDGIATLEEAAAVLENSPARLERAKALGALGSALRRARRPTDAREPLRRAAQLASGCGAAAYRARAQRAVRHGREAALGGGSGRGGLTTSERRVAGLAADGQQPRHRPGAVRDAQDRGGPPHLRLPQARDQLAARAADGAGHPWDP